MHMPNGIVIVGSSTPVDRYFRCYPIHFNVQNRLE